MVLPKVITNWSVSINGVGYLGKVKTLKLPELKEVEVDLDGCGFMAKQSVCIGYEKLTAEFSFLDINLGVYSSFGLGNVVGVIARAACGTGKDAEPLVAVMHGRFKTISPIELKAGEVSGETTVEMNVVRYSLFKNGIPLTTIDLENNVFGLASETDIFENTRNLIGG